MVKRIPATPYIDILKRVAKNGHVNFIQRDRMIIGCYDPDIDSDVGTHYVIYIPETAKYDYDFYDLTLGLIPSQIIATYNTHVSDLRELRMSQKHKPKDATIELIYTMLDDTHIEMVFEYILVGNVEYKSSIVVPYYTLESSYIDSYLYNLTCESFDKMLSYVELEEPYVIIDGIGDGLDDIAQQSVQVYYHKVKMPDGVVVRVPLIRSMLNGAKKFDDLYLVARKTCIKNIYLYILHYTVKGITEQHIGYVNNF